MKKNFYRNLACMLSFTGGLCIATSSKAQVTAGSKGVPNSGALLDMKQEDNTDGSANSKKGLGLPRVALTAVDKLDPCVVTTGVVATDNAAKKSHIGLTVYNTTDNTSTAATLSEGVYAWDGDMWTQYSGTTAGGAENGLSMSGRKVILGGPLNRSTTITGDATNNLTLNTPTKVGSTLGVTGATTLASTLGVTGATTLTGNLTSNGTTALKATNVTGNLTVSVNTKTATSTVTGNESVGGSSTIGMNTTTPTVGALLEIRNKQQDLAGVTDVRDPKMVSSDKGGLLLPRVELVSLASLEPFITGADAETQLSLAGLMVYNIAVSGNKIYPAIYVWSGTSWSTSQQSASQLVIDNSIATKTKSFTFYELGTETRVPLTVTVTGALGTPTYQWYQMTGNNVHVRTGSKIIGATSSSFLPVNGLTFNAAGDIVTSENILKGTTRNASNTGFYRYYCVVTDGYRTVETETVEVAVGCGAKTNSGEWITFMCYNLGANINTTIAKQKAATPTTITADEAVYGSLFQWGRIADGHQLRSSATINRSLTALTDFSDQNQFRCGTTATHPFYQVKKGTSPYGKFIFNSGAWNASAYNATLWTKGGASTNDPCMRYQPDGTYLTPWAESETATTANCIDVRKNSGWINSGIEIYGLIYKGGTLNGTVASATANRMRWDNGIVVEPDNVTTTLFFPPNGMRTYILELPYVGERVELWTSEYLINYTAAMAEMTPNGYNPSRSQEAYPVSSGGGVRCTKVQ